MRKIVNIPKGKGLGFNIFFVLILLFSSFLFRLADIAHGSVGDITLTASAFSDPDAEDTLQASEWVVRDSGGTVYDQTLGVVTTDTISSSTFTNGTTYYWKVRYQDNHDVWSDYSDEGVFIYGSSEVPSLTPTPDTPTPGDSTTSTVTATPTPDTATVTPTPIPEPSSSCIFGWRIWNGKLFCDDFVNRNQIYVP